MTLREVDPAVDPAWATVAAQPGGLLFQSPPWLRVIQRTYGMEVRAIVGEVDGTPVAGLPFARLRDPRGRRITTLPFSDFCDPISDRMEWWNPMIGVLLDEGVPTQIRCLHSPHPRQDERFTVVGGAKWHRVEVIGDSEQQWDELHPSARRAVRTARKAGLVVRQGRDRSDVRRFFELHLGVRKHKYRLVAQPYRFFDMIWEELFASGNGWVLFAEFDGQMVAGVMFLEWGGTWYYKFNASDPAWLDRRPNDLILWTAIEQATEAGVGAIDLGLSDADQDGLIRYKEKYARTSGDITTLRSTPAGWQAPGIAKPWATVLGKATGVLTSPRTPMRVTELGGSLLYRFFS